MKLVIGRGNARQVYDIPCATIVNRSKKEEVAQLANNIITLMHNRGVRFAPATAN
jgi:hypothetical protein